MRGVCDFREKIGILLGLKKLQTVCIIFPKLYLGLWAIFWVVWAPNIQIYNSLFFILHFPLFILLYFNLYIINKVIYSFNLIILNL